ncbi:hypothetical protein Cpap_1541 [Ruminiclostridium papyrosolvens DSM 2782]|uniref:Large polyvalent protein associated domain-containing protein n=1 Tax=Ruminiclostridium papyrosolvens DSM 2782 TaxID=588581 RepID=F1TEI3_9FIRM|nr:hypothetical protein [Ruminiclostridium papyrosolvens]EGD47149.1 hypothetical protein Cpap_1541 [Ruminiclostridium papyrosolvens DSM 2782]WES36091.1 hypothetical protein P0092_09045 [Ruminiclostridium papyrosolvens DSM 2782]WES36189.1 hypothetical protein P0092_09545 [Ruminiclostridium papyrosolvens DSM 2782]
MARYTADDIKNLREGSANTYRQAYTADDVIKMREELKAKPSKPVETIKPTVDLLKKDQDIKNFMLDDLGKMAAVKSPETNTTVKPSFIDNVKSLFSSNLGSITKDIIGGKAHIKSDEEVYKGMNPFQAALEKGTTEFLTGLNNAPRAVLKATGIETPELDKIAVSGDKRLENIQNYSGLKDVSGFKKTATDMVESVGNMLPSMVLPVAKLASIGISSGGNSARKAELEGATPQQALAYGALSGGIEAGTEKMFSAIPFLNKSGVADNAIKRIIEPIDNKIVKTLANRAVGAAGEGIEEVVSTALDPLAQKITYNENAKPASAGDLVNSFTTGAALAGVLGLPSTVVDIYNTRDSSTPQKAQEIAQTLPDTYESKNITVPVSEMSVPEQTAYVDKVKADVQDYATNKVNQLANLDEQEEFKRIQSTQPVTPVVQNTDILYPVQEITSVAQPTIETPVSVGTVNNIEPAAQTIPTVEQSTVRANTQSVITPVESSVANNNIQAPETSPINQVQAENQPTSNGVTLTERGYSTAGKDALISKKNVKAYQFDNPEVKPFYQDYAKYILDNEFVPNKNLNRDTKVMKMLREDTGLTPKDIKTGLEKLVVNQGQENVAAAKRIELVIDDMLTKGFDSVVAGNIPPVQDYIDIKNKLEGTNYTVPIQEDEDLPIPDINNNLVKSTVPENVQEPQPVSVVNEPVKNTINNSKQQKTPDEKKYDTLKGLLDELIAKKAKATTNDEIKALENDIEKVRINLQLFAQNSSKALTGEQAVSDFYKNSVLKSYIVPENVKSTLDELNYLYDMESNAGQLEQAVININKDMPEVINRLKSQKSLQSGTDTAEALIIEKIFIEQAKDTGDFSELDNWLQIVRERVTPTAQALQAMNMFKRFTPENTLLQAKKIVDESRTPADNKEIDNKAKRLKDELDNIQDDTGEVAKDAVKKAKELERKSRAKKQAIEGKDNPNGISQKDIDDMDPAELLMVKIESTLKEPKAKEHDFVNDMVNELFNVAKESPLPERVTQKDEPLNFMAQAIQNREQYRNIWLKAKEGLKAKYEGTEQFKMLSDYFEKGIKPTFSVKTLDAAIGRYVSSLKSSNGEGTVKETKTSLDDIVKNYYKVGEKTISNMVNEMVERAGLNKQDAATLEKYVRNRMHVLTKAKRESILASIFNEKPPQEVDRLRTVRQLSNLGAFKHETYANKAFKKLSAEAKKIVAKSGIDFGKVALSSVENEQLNKVKLLKEVSEKLDINDTDLKLVVNAISDEFDRVLEKKKDSIANVFSKREIKKKAFYDKLLDYYDKGYFNNPRLREIIAEKMGLPSLTDGAMEKLISETEQLAKLPKQGFNNFVQREEIETRILTDLKNIVPASWSKKVSTVQAIMQLLNLKTATRNILGNEGAYRSERAARNIMGFIDWGKSFVTGQREITFKKGTDLFRDTEGRWRFAKDLLKATKAAWKGYNLYGFEADKDVKHLTTSSNTFKSNINPFKWMEKSLNVTLRGFDYAAYMRGLRDMAGESAYVAGLNMGLKGKELKTYAADYLKNMDKTAFEAAKEYGRRITFQDSVSGIGDALGELKAWMNKAGTGNKVNKRGMKTHEFGMGDVMLKYGRTLGVMLQRSLEFSPAGFVMSAMDVHNAISAKRRGEPVNSKAITESISRAVFGTAGFTLMGALLESLGIISGGEDDYEMEDLQRKIGLGKYRINTSALFRYIISGFDKKEAKPKDGDFIYTYDWIQPVAMSFAFGANMSKDIRNKKRLTATGILDTAGAGVSGMMDTIGEQGGFTGITRFMQKKDIGDAVQYSAQNMITGFTGTFNNQLRQLTDNTTRDTSGDNFNKTLLNMIANRLPGLSKKLPEKIDETGEVKQVYSGDTNSPLNVFLNPAFVSRYKPTDGMKLLIDIYANTGETKIAPRQVEKSVTKNGIKINLTKDEIVQFQKDAGKSTMARLDTLKDNDAFNSLKTDYAKAEYVYRFMNREMEIARKKILRNIPNDDPRYIEGLNERNKKLGR